MCLSWSGCDKTNNFILFIASLLNCLPPSNSNVVTRRPSPAETLLYPLFTALPCSEICWSTSLLWLWSQLPFVTTLFDGATSEQTQNGLTESSPFLCDSSCTVQCSWWVPILVWSQASCHPGTWKLNMQLVMPDQEASQTGSVRTKIYFVFGFCSSVPNSFDGDLGFLFRFWIWERY